MIERSIQHSASDGTVSTDSASTAALEVRDLESGYGSTTVLRSVDLRVPAGSIVGLLGPNGAGKTTLLRTVSGLIHATQGSVHLYGTDVTTTSPTRRARLGLCHVPEGRGIFRSLTVHDNIRLQARNRSGESVALEKAVAAFPPLGQRMSQIAGTMSGGEQQMLAMSAAYVRDPSLIVVDEASLGLAPIVVDNIFEFLAKLAATGTALLIVDQFVERTLALADHAYVLSRGTVVFDGAPRELLDNDDLFQRYLTS